MSILSLEKKVDEIAKKLDAPRSFILETAIDVISKYPILTNAVLSAEIDLIWHTLKKKRILDSQDQISISSLKKGFDISPNLFLSASIVEWDANEGSLVLGQENEIIQQYLLPSQISFYSNFSKLITAVTCSPEHFYRPLPALLPTPSIVFHISNMIKDVSVFWFSILNIKEFHDNRCLIVLKPFNNSMKSSTMKLLSNRKFIFRFLQHKSVIGLSKFKKVDSSMIECTNDSIYIICDDGPSIQETNFLASKNLKNIADIRPGMSGFSLFCTIIAVSENRPVKLSENTLDRFAVKVTDGSGVVDITSWGNVAKAFSRLYTGQVAFFANLASSENNSEGKYFIKAQPEYYASVTVVSTLPAFLKSETVLNMSTLASFPYSSFVVSDINVTSYSSSPFCKLAHSTCQKPLNLEHTIWTCPICKVEIPPGSLDQAAIIYSISWNISDKSNTLSCEALSSASSAIIGIDAEEFYSLSLEKQTTLLECTLKNQYRVGIVSILESKKKPSSLRFRLEVARKIAHN